MTCPCCGQPKKPTTWREWYDYYRAKGCDAQLAASRAYASEEVGHEVGG